jgi:hypothetical protein
MHYKLSKNEWLAIGSKAGWLKSAQEKKNSKFFLEASEDDIRSYVASMDEGSAQELADHLAQERDGFTEDSNSARRVALRDEAGGDIDSYTFQLKVEKEKLKHAAKLAKVLGILMNRFPSVNISEAKKPMSRREDVMEGLRAEPRDI